MDIDSRVYIANHQCFIGAALERGLRQRGWKNLLLRTAEELPLNEAAKLANFFSEASVDGIFLPFVGTAKPEALGNCFAALANVLEQAQRAGIVRIVILLTTLDEVGNAAVRLCESYNQQYGTHYIVAVSEVLYGCADAAEGTDYVREIIRQMHEAKLQSLTQVVLSGEAACEREFLFVDDMAAAGIYLIESYEDTKPLYVSSGKPCSRQLLADTVAKVVGYDGTVQFDGQKMTDGLEQHQVPEKFSRMSGGAGVTLAQGTGGLYQWYREKVIRISACVVMRDAEQDIAKCLESVQDSVDEMIIVDTGSQDRSVEIAKQFTDQVYFYEWKDDFSAAKNFALDKASGDWIVFLDADEYFTEDTRKNLRPIISSVWGRPSCDTLSIRMDNVDEDRNHRVKDSVVVLRAFRNTQELRYYNSIHEELKFLDGHMKIAMDIRRRDLLLLHTGYSTKRMQVKTERNLRLLQQELQEHPEQELIYYYLSGIYSSMGDFKRAMDYARKSVLKGEKPIMDGCAAYRTWLRSAQALHEEKEVMRAVQAGMKDFPLIPDFQAEYGAALYNKEKFDEALPYFLRTEQYYQDFEKNNPHEVNRFAMVMPTIYKVIGELLAKNGEDERAALYQKKSEEAQAAFEVERLE